MLMLGGILRLNSAIPHMTEVIEDDTPVRRSRGLDADDIAELMGDNEPIFAG
jgi:hypothetical protein